MAFFSVITPTFNRAPMLKDAIESVLIQDFKELEHIIIDNGSTDETSKIVEDYAREFPNIHFISLPKPNLPRAINEGLIKSRGRVIGILCDDDLYPQGALQAIAQVFHDNKEVDIVSTGIQIVRNIGNQFIVEKEAYPKFSVHDLLFHTPYESARFLRRSLIYKVGLLNEDLGVSSQREWPPQNSVNGSKNLLSQPCLLYFEKTFPFINMEF